MNHNETLAIMSVLRGAYPAFYRDMARREADSVVALWESMFADDPFEIVAAAVKALIATDDKGFPPHIGAVKARIRQITQPKEMTEMEAWNLVKRAMRNGFYGAETEYAKLPETVQSVIGSPQRIREWAVMDTEEVDTVIASNFQRSYRAKAKAEKEYAALPSDVRALADKLGGALALESKPAVAQLTDGEGNLDDPDIPPTQV